MSYIFLPLSTVMYACRDIQPIFYMIYVHDVWLEFIWLHLHVYIHHNYLTVYMYMHILQQQNIISENKISHKGIHTYCIAYTQSMCIHIYCKAYVYWCKQLCEMYLNSSIGSKGDVVVLKGHCLTV